MPSKRTEYWVLVKPKHPIYGIPTTGKGKMPSSIEGIEAEEIETAYFRKYVQVCGSGCPWELFEVTAPTFGLYEVCYSIAELRKSYKRALKGWKQEEVRIMQRVTHKTFITH